jgi:Uncharacterised nucleotidyltransferase
MEKAVVRPGMQSLVELLRGGQPWVTDDAEWAVLLTVAEQENVLPWVAERLHDLSCQPEQKKRLDEIRRQAQISTFVWTETLKNTLAAFDRAGVPVVSLKGPCLAERLYGNAALRTSYDLDLLVRPNDVVRAEQVLTEVGFVPHGEADDYHRPWRGKATILELHHNVENPEAFELNLEAIWARTQIAEFQGVPIRLLGADDELLFLCLHAVRHRFERLYLIFELALAFRKLAAGSPVATEPFAPEFDNVLLLGWMMAAQLSPQIPEPQAARVRPHNRKRLQKLADQLWEERMLEPAQMLDWKAQHSFYLEVEDPGWNRLKRRARHARILMTRLIDADFAFARRFHLHRHWQVRLLRPVRLVIKAFRPEARAV